MNKYITLNELLKSNTIKIKDTDNSIFSDYNTAANAKRKDNNVSGQTINSSTNANAKRQTTAASQTSNSIRATETKKQRKNSKTSVKEYRMENGELVLIEPDTKSKQGRGKDKKPRAKRTGKIVTVKKSTEIASKFYVGLVIINSKGQVLLGKRQEDGIWTGPGGGSDIGETPEQTAVREAFEEAQLEIDKEQLIKLDTLKAGNGKEVYCFLYYTNQKKTNPNLDPDEEVKKWEWFSQDKIPKDLIKDSNRHLAVMNGLMTIKGLKKSFKPHKYLSKINGKYIYDHPKHTDAYKREAAFDDLVSIPKYVSMKDIRAAEETIKDLLQNRIDRGLKDGGAAWKQIDNKIKDQQRLIFSSKGEIMAAIHENSTTSEKDRIDNEIQAFIETSTSTELKNDLFSDKLSLFGAKKGWLIGYYVAETEETTKSWTHSQLLERFLWLQFKEEDGKVLEKDVQNISQEKELLIKQIARRVRSDRKVAKQKMKTNIKKSQPHKDDCKRHMSEHAKYIELHEKLKSKIKTRKTLDKKYKTPAAGEEAILNALERMDYHGEQYTKLSETLRQKAAKGSDKIEKSNKFIAMQDHELHEQYQADKKKEGVSLDKGGPGSGKKDNKQPKSDALKDHATSLKNSYINWATRLKNKPDDAQAKQMVEIFRNKMKDFKNRYDLDKSMLKSLMGIQEGTGVAINTADQAITDASSQDWLSRFQNMMANFNYGDEPRQMQLNSGHSIILTKVDDGLYTGFVKRHIDEDGRSELEENVAKVEQSTLSDIIQYLKSREYLLNTPVQEPVVADTSKVASLDKKLELCRLLNSILNEI